MSTDPNQDMHQDPTDSDLGFPDRLAGRLRSSLRREADGVTAPASLYEEVRRRRSRRRWWTLGGLAVAGVAATTAAVLAIGGGGVVPSIDDNPDVVTEPPSAAPSPSPDTSPSAAASVTEEPSSTSTDGPTPGATSPDESTPPTRTVADGIEVPALEVVRQGETGLALVERATDTSVVAVTALDVQAPAPVRTLAVRPGSTPDRFSALVSTTGTDDAPVRLHLLVGSRDGGELTPLPDEFQPDAEVGVTGLVTTAWSPDGAAVAVSYAGAGTRVLTLDGDEVTADSNAVPDFEVQTWGAADDPGTTGREFRLYGRSTSAATLVARDGVVDAQGAPRLLEPDDADAITVPAGEEVPDFLVVPVAPGQLQVTDGTTEDGEAATLLRVVATDGTVLDEVAAPQRGVAFGSAVEVASVGDAEVVRYLPSASGTVLAAVADDGTIAVTLVDEPADPLGGSWVD